MSNKVQGIILFALGLISLVWFFSSYAQQEPSSLVSLNMSENNAELAAAEVLADLGYALSNYETEVTFNSNASLLDSLQHNLGRNAAIDSLKNDKGNIKAYYWKVLFENSNPSNKSQNNSQENRFGEDSHDDLVVHMDEAGKLIAFHNRGGQLPSKLVNREALGSVFLTGTDSTAKVFQEVPDSLLSRLMYFDLEQTPKESRSSNFAESVSRQLQTGRPYRYDSEDARRMAEYYVQRTGWDLKDFEADTVIIERISTENAARVQFQSKAPVLKQDIQFNVKVSPTGSLLELNYSYNPNGRSGDGFSIWPILKLVFAFLFVLAGVILFFFRIRSRAIDTQSALVVAVVMGLAVSTLIFLGSINSLELFSNSASLFDSIMLLIQIGIGGAVSSIGFFILFALSDSITRQYWPEKLLTYDYLRRGMLFSKPIGLTMLRSIALGVIIMGLWSLCIRLLPSMYFHVEYVYMHGTIAWPPLFALLQILALSLIMSLSVFMVIGSQVYAQTKNVFSVAIATVLSSTVVLSFMILVGPELEQFLLGLALGAALTFIYLKWDFLTLFFSLFTFLVFLTTSSGWVIEGSPDWYVFVSLMLLLVFLFIGGMAATFKGKDEGVLPKYIPEYVEELAQEERIKQELEIARGVQESFLPVRMPEIEGLDIAALCKPAYETGGDYYDVIKLNDHQVAITIGDVSGKGIPAAFYMTFTKGILHSLCRETDSPGELLIKANRLFCENAKKGTFISLIYGIVDLKEKTFTFARAGHNPIIRMNNETGEAQELKPVGLGLGLTKEVAFERNIKEVELSLTPEDTLVLYTDGIVEALNTSHSFYGDKKLVKSIKPHLNKPSKEILHHLMYDVTEFIGTAKQHDDMTVMVLKIN